jgi:hypothetical protein
MEMVDIANYKRQVALDYPEMNFRGAVVADLTRRRDEHCPTPEKAAIEIPSELVTGQETTNRN